MTDQNVVPFPDRPHDALARLLPEHAGEVQARFQRDAAFREICCDFASAEKRLEELEAAPPCPLRAEYTALRRDLLTEIVQRLEDGSS
jgi:hypothetical protein